MRRAAQDLIHAVCNAGVHLCMGQTRTAEQLKDAGFEAVINAVGAHSAAPRIPGIDSVNVADAWKVLAGEQQVYGTVAVIGGGTAGVFAAICAARTGAKTVLVEKNSMLGGTLTVAGVNFPGLFYAWQKQIVAGPCWDAILECVKLGGAKLPDRKER